jgi:uncharacterized surface protein with fasciclin (FAS1) repeats
MNIGSKSVYALMSMALLGISAQSTLAGQCGSCGSSGRTKDIVDTAVSAGSFDTLVTAVKAADLVGTLKSPGPFTVFAPTDEAFAKLPQKTLQNLLKDPDRLGAILKYHVVPGKLMAADVVTKSLAKTALGQTVTFSTTRGVRIDNAKVTQIDIVASNGVIHVIDTVLMPKDDIVEVARTAGSFKTLLAALEAAELTDALRGAGPFTVFAPTDEAFGKLPQGTVEGLLNDIPKLRAILTYHVVAGQVMASDVVKLREAKTLQGQSVSIDAKSGVRINSARVVKADVPAENGVIHVVDEVLLPPTTEQSNATTPAEELIREAINRGAPLYNDGHHAACTAVYEVAAMGLLASFEEGIGCKERSTLTNAMAAVKRSNDAGKSAWIMRHALDEVYASLAGAVN